MPKWVVDKGDNYPKCGAIEVLLDKDNKFDTEQGLGFPKAERCTECDWKHEIEEEQLQGE